MKTLYIFWTSNFPPLYPTPFRDKDEDENRVYLYILRFWFSCVLFNWFIVDDFWKNVFIYIEIQCNIQDRLLWVFLILSGGIDSFTFSQSNSFTKWHKEPVVIYYFWVLTSYVKKTNRKWKKKQKKTKGKQSIKIWELCKSMKHLEHNYYFTSKIERRSILRSFILIAKTDKGLGAIGVNKQHSYIDC